MSNGELVFALDSGGTLNCFDAGDGTKLWSQDVSQGEGTFDASPVLAGGRLYLLDSRGVTHMVKAARQFQLIGRAELSEPCLGASPAFQGGRIYIRAQQHLYCIGSVGRR